MVAPHASDWFARADALLQLHRPADAAKLARQRLAQAPDDVQAHLTLTQALLAQGRLADARTTATHAVHYGPEEPEAFFILAQTHGRLGELARADEALSMALRLNPYAARYFAFRSQLYYLLNMPRGAVEAAEEGLGLNPQHPDCLLWWSLAHEQLRQSARADEGFSRLLRVAPNSGFVHAKFGAALLARYAAAPALAHLQEALRLDPKADQPRRLLRSARRRAVWPRWWRLTCAWLNPPTPRRGGPFRALLRLVLLPLLAGFALYGEIDMLRHPLPGKLPWPERLRRLPGQLAQWFWPPSPPLRWRRGAVVVVAGLLVALGYVRGWPPALSWSVAALALLAEPAVRGARALALPSAFWWTLLLGLPALGVVIVLSFILGAGWLLPPSGMGFAWALRRAQRR
ncbi:tetratricopeptide repeat protein [Hymenobacter sp. 15J16-1T3B]|uniref:tetratricopeptide repeat protein n=1 Tax=Hymenobacter sp. 15J16-1T3B TaxID=2886941 RepID=UPI001D0F740C|nr:tetratricopeptide repeat protein [Hymenobacter sp. 15J16-1T3B]MCC3158151.1 tetratricopeptide repeat protein [Hymenobacter sp. 15J16-1T3B]